MPNYCSNTLRVSATNKSKEAIEQLQKFINDVHDKGEIIPQKEAKDFREKYIKDNFDNLYKDNLQAYTDHQTMPVKKFMVDVLYFSFEEGEYRKNGSLFSMRKILPTPEELFKYSAPVRAEYGETEKEFKERVARCKKLYGAEDWYHWQCDNWGTKWDLCDVYIDDKQKDGITYSFTTAWSPPEAFLKTICVNYPLLDFHLEFEEPGCAFQGELEIVAGEVTNEATWDYEEPEVCCNCGEELEEGESLNDDGECPSCAKENEEE